MKIFNSLSRKVEEIEASRPPQIGLYTCGPTVYSTATIANFRTYSLSDFLIRSLTFLGYQVKSVMNLTDVGHLTGDNEGDSNQGEDRLEKASKREGRSAWDIARDYGNEFLAHMKLMNIEMPSVVCKATEHIPEQIAMVQKLEDRGLTYKIADGIYFDTVKFESLGNKYGELSNLDEMKAGARLEPNPEKKNPRDFALWKFSPQGARRQMEWDSPWGVGFPGWHIECSAMSVKYLGDQFEIHVGGEDLRSTHHPNEIAQAEGASGKHPFVKYWVHGAFILVDGGRMGKSLGNAYTVEDIVKRGYDPLALRYFYLTGHYRRQLNFTWEALDAASVALTKLRRLYQSFISDSKAENSSNATTKYKSEFVASLENDLNMPEALATLWEVTKSDLSPYDKAMLMREFDKVFGLKIESGNKELAKSEVPQEINELLTKREEARKSKNWHESDEIRDQILKMGWVVVDKGETQLLEKKL